MKNEHTVHGVDFRCEPSEQPNFMPGITDTVALLGLCFLLLVSFGGTVLSLLGLSPVIFVSLLWAVFCLVGAYCFYRFRRFRLWIALGAGILVLIIVFVGNSFFTDGFGIAVNSVKDLLGTFYGRLFLPLPVSGEHGEAVSLTVFLFPVTMVMAAVACYAVFGRGYGAAVTILLFLCIGLVLALSSPFWLWYGLFFASLLMVFIARNGRIAEKKGRGKLLFSVAIFSVAVTMLFCAAPSLGFFPKNDMPPGVFSALETKVADVYDQLRWTKDATHNLPEGDFSDVGKLRLKEKDAFEISMSVPQTMYLRGYVGNVYRADGWHDVNKKKNYDYADDFYWLHRNGFYGMSQLSAAAAAAGMETEENHITIRPLGARKKYIYAPYEYNGCDIGLSSLRFGDDAPSVKDYEEEEYTYTASTNLVRSSSEMIMKLHDLAEAGDETALQYFRNEAVYREYVYDINLFLPKDVREMLSVRFDEPDLSEGHPGYDTVMQLILNTLLTEYSYNEKVSSNDGKDLVVDFMENTAEGYSVHYASAAALIFRYFGIPSRYVEGYILTPYDVLAVAPDETVTVTGKNAHAWVEYYRDGVGWLPFEVTPPYLYVMDQPENIKALFSDFPDTESNQNGMTELQDDNYEDIEEDDTPAKGEDNHHLALPLLIVAILFLLLLFAVLFLILRRRKKRKAREKAILSAEPRTRVDLLFCEALVLLRCGGLVLENGSLDAALVPLREMGGEGIASRYRMFAALHRETVFSDHPITVSRCRGFYLFRDEALEFAKERSSLRKRLMDQYIRCLY